MSRTKDSKLWMAVYVAICDHIQEYGRFPTYRQLVDATHYETTSAISFHMNTLVEVGLIEFEEVGLSSCRKFSVKGGQWTPPPAYWEYKFHLEGTVIGGSYADQQTRGERAQTRSL